MGKLAFVFSGQGDQYPGMGKDIYEKFDAARNVFASCDEIRPGTSTQCFEGTAEELKETKNTQACLFAMELAAAKTLESKGIKPDMAAGFSLGEVVAATYTGIFDEKCGFSLVCKRGELMQAAADKADTAMAAVVKLDNETVERLCEAYTDVYPVNYNCPGQVSVAGLSSQMTDFAADVKEAGGRAIPLKVNGAFHSPFMKEASEKFAHELEIALGVSKDKAQKFDDAGASEKLNIELTAKSGSEDSDKCVSEKFNEELIAKSGGEDSDKCVSEKFNNTIKLYSDLTAQPYTDDVINLLSEQICSPVRWEQIIRNMIADGVDTFIEIGPGKTLTNMIKKIDVNVKAESYTSYL